GAAFEGRSLKELELPKAHGVWVLAVVRRDEAGHEMRELASAATRLERGDRLVALGTREGFAQLLSEVKGGAAPLPQAPAPAVPPPGAPAAAPREPAPDEVLPEARRP
ncbi:TrkA C-terminal domain-containing protein, partial [bacterium]|nr:TrkA C-terminal domain-containing protein [bacterium]